jgi:hypothetical protein
VTPAPQTDLQDALKRAGSSVKSQKTEKISNKNKEQMSIAGAIIKLLEREPLSNNGMTATMSMKMRQMEALNKRMDKKTGEKGTPIGRRRSV